MQNLCEIIKNKLSCLPPEDVKICERYFENRDFISILEIAKSVLIMKEKDAIKDVHQEKWEKVDTGELQELITSIQEYVSFIDVPEFYSEKDYYDWEELI